MKSSILEVQQRGNLADYDVGQDGAVLKRPHRYAGDIVADFDAGYAGTISERPGSDASDRQANDSVGDGHRTAGAGISRDGDRVVIDRIRKLGIHHGGEHPEHYQKKQPRAAGKPSFASLFGACDAALKLWQFHCQVNHTA